MGNNFNFSEFTQDDLTNLQAICSLENQSNELPVIDLTGRDTYTHFAQAVISLIGDQVAFDCLIMHSKPYFDLVQQQIADKVFMANEIPLCNIYTGQHTYFNKTIVVTDSIPFYEKAGKPLVYNIFGLAFEKNKLVPVFKAMVN